MFDPFASCPKWGKKLPLVGKKTFDPSITFQIIQIDTIIFEILLS
jgi:hypothetical protein